MTRAAERTMTAQFMVQDGERWLALGDQRFEVQLEWRLGQPST